MSNFTHTMRVTVTLDDGRVIQATNTYVIPNVAFVAQQSGFIGNPLAFGSLPPIQIPDFLIMAGVGADSYAEINNDDGDDFQLVLRESEVFITHGPTIFSQDTSNTNANVSGSYTGMALAMGAVTKAPSYMMLNNTAS